MYISVVFNKLLFYPLVSFMSTVIETAVSFRSVIFASVCSFAITWYIVTESADTIWPPGEHRIFHRKYSTKTCFDEVDIRQNDTLTKACSTKWLSRRSVVRQSVVYPWPVIPMSWMLKNSSITLWEYPLSVGGINWIFSDQISLPWRCFRMSS